MAPRGSSEENLSRHSEIQLRGFQEERNEEPPPPYPGNSSSRDTSITDSPTPTRTHDYDTTGENGPRPADRRGSAIVSNEEHHVMNAWIDSEAVHRISSSETSNEPCRSNSCQSTNTEGRNLNVNVRDANILRTFVSHSLKGVRGAVSTTHTLPSVNAELTEAV